MHQDPELPLPPRNIVATPIAPNRPSNARIGAVQYLNTRPLIYGLSGNVDFDLPSRLADRLSAGELDAALIPSIELLRGLADQQDSYQIVSQSCIACRGPVMSVRIFFRTRPERIRRLAVDEGSRTSVALCRILLYERFGLVPELETLPIKSTAAHSNADAILLIGDRAIAPTGGGFQAVWDLGDEWYRWTGLPFVFAVWAARTSVANRDLAERLDNARERGRANLAAIAAAEAGPHGLTVPQCLDYLRENLHYELGEAEWRGLRLFYEYASHLKLAPAGCNLSQAFYRSPLSPTAGTH